MFNKPPRLAILAMWGIVLTALFAPVNYIILTPGDAVPLFPSTVKLAKDVDIKSYPVNGQMHLLTIYVTNPETTLLGYEVLACWMQAECVTYPRFVYYDDKSTNESEYKSSAVDMEDSQNVAVIAARNVLAKIAPDIDTSNLNNKTLKVNLDNVGGPSGGVIFTLGLIELLTPEDFLHGRTIAGTGTIDEFGNAGSIGGVSEKVIVAKKLGASVIFVPVANCDELPDEVEGISVIAISTIEEALGYLRGPQSSAGAGDKALNSAGIHGCANLGS